MIQSSQYDSLGLETSAMGFTKPRRTNRITLTEAHNAQLVLKLLLRTDMAHPDCLVWANGLILKPSSQGSLYFAFSCLSRTVSARAGSRRLLLRQTVQRAETQHKVHGVDAHHGPIGEQFAEKAYASRSAGSLKVGTSTAALAI